MAIASPLRGSRRMVQPIAVEDVKREVKILKALTGHENVVQFYDAFEDDSYVYIVMELCEGGELLDRILAKKESRYTEKDAAVVVRQMLKVAAECHLHGLVHRDMKPENFLLKSTKEDSPLKATDFGLSDFIKPGKKFHDIVGSAYYVAPEVLKRKSGPQSDVWSIGVITYILLSGRRPFWDKTEDGIFKEVLRKKPDFHRKPWTTISNAAIDFVKKLLVKDPRARLTAAQALSHPWVREGGEASEIPIDISVLSNMRQFVKYSRLKQFALRALASTLNEEELADLKDQFDAIDVDKNGSISLEEMRQALAKDLPWKLKEPRVLEILQAIDSNTDGLVDFSEFVAATLHVHQLEDDSDKWQLRSQAAFEKFDIDKDGYISPEELKMHTGLRGSIDPLLEEADIDKDGKISLSEFRRLLRTASMSSQKVSSPTVYKRRI
ncbi:calcium-dependent protein kinase 28-like isoform X2 [Phaseolus vulgaris]|uniref:calcium-dependent protein kinase 28-like isoform X2 n=1 Tax=Phaseolus vulgaris TaxID=3885 RepID=UPI0035CA6171